MARGREQPAPRVPSRVQSSASVMGNINCSFSAFEPLSSFTSWSTRFDSTWEWWSQSKMSASCSFMKISSYLEERSGFGLMRWHKVWPLSEALAGLCLYLLCWWCTLEEIRWQGGFPLCTWKKIGAVNDVRASLVAYICWQFRRPGYDSRVRKILWRREWPPTPLFLPGESHGQGNLVGYSPWGHKLLDTTEWLSNDVNVSGYVIFWKSFKWGL